MAKSTDYNLYDQVQRLQKRVNDLERQKNDIQRVKGSAFIESLKERLGSLVAQGTAGVSTNNIDRTAFDTNNDAVTVLDYPDGFLLIEFEGQTYNVPFYNSI